jgi:ureidoglycolate dehydrogenase (NAD+)
MREITISDKRLKEFIRSVLLKAGVREDVAGHVAEGLVQTSLRGVDSHGVRLLPHYLSGVKNGRINPVPVYKFTRTSPSTGKFDADHTFGHAAGIEAARKAVELAGEAGTGHVAVHNSTHFGAAACYTLEIAKHDMIGMAFTHADSLLKTYAGNRAFLGTNPISFAAPCKGEEPFCLDMATSAITFNKVKQLREQKLTAPAGSGANSDGIETTDPDEITMLLPIGGYKGYGLSMAVEILCSLLTGMPYGPNISSMFKAPMSRKRFLGHFVSAIRIDCFQDVDSFKERMARLMDELRNEPPSDKKVTVQVAGDPEKRTAQIRRKDGIPVKEVEFKAFEALAEEYGVEFSI